MNIKTALLKEHSKPQTIKIANYIGDDTLRFKELMDLFLGSEYRISQRASWVVGLCTEQYPELIKPYLKKIIDNLDNPIHDAVKRNTVRILQDIKIPESLIAKTTEHCFRFLSTPSEPIAVRVFSMTVLLNITKKHPDLRNELRILIENQLPYSTAAFISRGRKVLKELALIR